MREHPNRVEFSNEPSLCYNCERTIGAHICSIYLPSIDNRTLMDKVTDITEIEVLFKKLVKEKQ